MYSSITQYNIQKFSLSLQFLSTWYRVTFGGLNLRFCRRRKLSSIFFPSFFHLFHFFLAPIGEERPPLIFGNVFAPIGEEQTAEHHIQTTIIEEQPVDHHIQTIIGEEQPADQHIQPCTNIRLFHSHGGLHAPTRHALTCPHTLHAPSSKLKLISRLSLRDVRIYFIYS